MKHRMEAHLDFVDRNEIFSVMGSVVKNIDGGWLTKSHCPIVTDVGLKRKATLVLMHYNPSWLRISLYMIFGGYSFLSNGESNSDQEISFLKMVIDNHFFSHDALAKAYAYNKTVEGLYRPGYYEQLGNVILKRFLLLVRVLDRAKSQSFLSLNYGIDGLDGGSAPLYMAQSSIKSSCQVINDFLSSDVMHGEGNLLSHLVAIGCKLTFEQGFLVEYDFKMEDLFGELHDGVRLCLAVQLITNNPSILLKIVAPSDLKKKLANCSVALQYLKQAGVQLCNEEGITIVKDDIVGGDKELTVSLLWNIFVHLQIKLGLSAFAKDTRASANLLVSLLGKAVGVVPLEL